MNEVTLQTKRLLDLIKAEGIVKTMTIAQKAWIRNRASNKEYHSFQEQYVDPLIFIAGYPKSGSSWFAQMLAELPGFAIYHPMRWAVIDDVNMDKNSRMPVYAEMKQEFTQRLAIIKGHTWGTPENIEKLQQLQMSKCLITVRDPRDAVISAYWYIRNNPHHYDYGLAHTCSLSEFIDQKLESGRFEYEFISWLQDWLTNRSKEHSMIVRYEDLLSNTLDTMQQVLQFLGIEITPEAVFKMVSKHDFSNKSGRERGSEDRRKFMRKAMAGEWHDILTKEQNAAVVSVAQPVLAELGYPFYKEDIAP